MTPWPLAVADPGREPVPLAHHFDDPEQQHDSATLGMWAFLATEVMFFGGVLTAYTVFRILYPNEFAAASHYGLTSGSAASTPSSCSAAAWPSPWRSTPRRPATGGPRWATCC